MADRVFRDRPDEGDALRLIQQPPSLRSPDMVHAAPEPPPIRARLLGALDVQVGDRTLPASAWPRRHARAVLLLLLGTPGHRVSRDAVIDAIWPEHDLDASLNALYKALHALRRTLEPDLTVGKQSAYVDISNEAIALVSSSTVWVDVDQFEWHLRQARSAADPRLHLRSALALYRGDFAADEPYVDWPVPRRESLRAARMRAALTLARLDCEANEPLASIDHLESMLIEDPAFEDAHRAIIRAMLASGQRSLALQQYERCRVALAEAYGSEPDAETRALAAAAGEAVEPAVNRSALGGRGVFRQVPGIPTVTIGRAGDQAIVQAMLQPDHTRMVTVVGPGGVGKTRLALEVARSSRDAFPDGVAFVDLTGTREVEMLPVALMQALGIHAAADRTAMESIQAHLADLPGFLLVLDNLEHLPGVADPVAELLDAMPALTILATSREPLRIRAEWVYRLHPLATPDPSMAAEAAREVDSVHLFLQRSQAWGGAAEVTDRQLADIATLCTRLEGLPLAIELAAARTWEMESSEILAAIDDRFAVLRNGPHDIPDRHRALEATIDWSYDLLSAAEQRLYRGLAVFAGGVPLDALEAMFGDQAIPLAQRLADKSLVFWMQRDGGRRLDMLAATRDHALRMVDRHHELADMQKAHASFFANLAAHAGHDDAKRGTVQVAWIRRLEREQENIHLALENCLRLGESDTALILCNVMGNYWDSHIPAAQARAWIERALALEPEGHHLSAGWAAMWGATFAWHMADVDAMTAFEERARQTWTVLDSPVGLAWVNYSIASRMGFESRYEDVADVHRANLPVFRQAGDVEGIVKSLSGLSCALGMTDHPVESVQTLDEALAISREHDNLLLQSYVLARLPTALLIAGDEVRAEQMAVEGERAARLAGDRQSLPWASMVQASLAHDRDDPQTGLRHAQAALGGFRDTGDRLNEWLASMACLIMCTVLGRLDDAAAYARETIRGVRAHGCEEDHATVLPELAMLLLAQGHHREALIAFASGMSTDERLGVPIPESNLKRYHEHIEIARSHLAPTEADLAWNQGTTMPAGDALTLALRVTRLRAGEADPVA